MHETVLLRQLRLVRHHDHHPAGVGDFERRAERLHHALALERVVHALAKAGVGGLGTHLIRLGPLIDVDVNVNVKPPVNANEAELHYPLGESVPATGATLEAAPGVRWLRRVALEACVQARNEGRSLAREGNDVIREACRWSPELAAACELWKEIKFEFDAVDTL